MVKKKARVDYSGIKNATTFRELKVALLNLPKAVQHGKRAQELVAEKVAQFQG